MTKPNDAKLEILADPEVLARRVADWLLGLATAKQGVFSVALSGGSTPRRLYELLAASPRRNAFPWARTHWFWGDERFVAHDDPQSNYLMVREAMLSQVPIPGGNIHSVPTIVATPEEAAKIYEQDLKAFYGADVLEVERPLFDVVLLGLGVDGHTASLFPNTKVLEVRDRWVAAVTDGTAEARVTLTYPALESSQHVAFLITGDEKRDVFNRLRHGDADVPAARLHPVGELIWFVDTAAASGVPS
jgi:6-phosphogluconolactonase